MSPRSRAAEKGIDHRVREHIAVAVAQQPLMEGYRDAAQNQRAALHQRVDVYAYSQAAGHPPAPNSPLARATSMASAMVRSWGVVTLMLPGDPVEDLDGVSYPFNHGGVVGYILGDAGVGVDEDRSGVHLGRLDRPQAVPRDRAGHRQVLVRPLDGVGNRYRGYSGPCLPRCGQTSGDKVPIDERAGTIVDDNPVCFGQLIQAPVDRVLPALASCADGGDLAPVGTPQPACGRARYSGGIVRGRWRPLAMNPATPGGNTRSAAAP